MIYTAAIQSFYPTLKKVCCLLWIYFFISFSGLSAQSLPAPEYQVKAAFLYNFTRFIDWPPGAFKSQSDPFVIGIAGDDSFDKYIADMVRGEKVGEHPIVVRRYLNGHDIGDYHMLFIQASASSRMKEILKAASRHSVLTVSDAKGFTDMGGIIGFYRENKKIKFQINLASSRDAQLTISSKLLSVAQVNKN